MNISRRSLIAGAVGAAASCALGSSRAFGESALVRPPGGQDESLLWAGCIRCGRCVEACPHHVIKFAPVEKGFVNMRTPVLSFEAAYCDWCADQGAPQCVAACPTKALQLPPDASFENVVMGVAKIDTQSCLSYRDNGCRLCADACPLHAILVSRDNRVFVQEDLCNGCGACEASCPSLQYGSVGDRGVNERAIVVHAREEDGEAHGFNRGEGWA